MKRLFASLTSRLVLTAVALVVVISVVIGAFATLAIQNRLTAQVDDQLKQTARQGPFLLRAAVQSSDGPDGPPGGTRPGTVVAGFPISSTGDAAFKINNGQDDPDALGKTARDALERTDADGQIHEVAIPGLGDYRVEAVQYDDGLLVVGLPTGDVDDAVHSLILYEAILIAGGAIIAAGGGLLLVRRQLRPLRQVAATANEVAQLPLAEGDIALDQRVPDKLTDARTEVGQVGSALNTLLAHVESSLDARHRSEQQVRQFVADASHELRTPLATITGYTELARSRPSAENVDTALAKVEEESARMTALVEDLLLLARLDAGRPLDRAPVDLTRLLLEAVADAQLLAPEHTWRLDLPDEPLEVIGDEQRLHQVVTNLLTNARKHTPPGTTVTVIGRTDGFDVRDDGPGFPPDFAAKAFERFARVDEARTRTGGAGLGLSLVEAIVRAHGGTVALDSAPGQTTIAVRLVRLPVA